MLTIKFKFCCSDCPSRDTYIDEHRLEANNVEFATKTTIGCAHEKVCKEYIEFPGCTIHDHLEGGKY